jgi:hypothetical protein
MNDDERRYRTTTWFLNSRRRETRVAFFFGGVVVLSRERVVLKGGPWFQPVTVERAAVRQVVRVRDFEALGLWSFGFEAVDGSYLRVGFKMHNGRKHLPAFGWPVEMRIIDTQEFLNHVAFPT